MFVVTEAEAAAIRAAFDRGGEFSAAVELRRLFPAVTDTAEARACARTIAAWEPLPVKPAISFPSSPMPALARNGHPCSVRACFNQTMELKTGLARPDRHLGPPPPHLVAAGRMNTRGISVFYGANTQAAALAEVRPPVGSQVAIARFDIIRPLKLLDLTVFEGLVERGSIFDSGYIRALRER